MDEDLVNEHDADATSSEEESIPDLFTETEVEEAETQEQVEAPTEEQEQVEAAASSEAPEAEAAPETAQVPDELARAMALIEKRDVELRRREQDLRETQSAARELSELREELHRDPLSALRKVGKDESALIDAIAGVDPQQDQIASSPAVKKLMAEIESLKETQSSREAERQRQAEAEVRSRTYAEYRQTAEAADKEKSPLLNTFADHHAPTVMFERAREYVVQNDAMPTPSQMAEAAEAFLDQQVRDVIERVRDIPKYRDMMLAGKPGDSRSAASTSQSPPPTGKTLRNQDTAEPPPKAREIDWSTATDREILEHGISATGAKLFE